MRFTIADPKIQSVSIPSTGRQIRPNADGVYEGTGEEFAAVRRSGIKVVEVPDPAMVKGADNLKTGRVGNEGKPESPKNEKGTRPRPAAAKPAEGEPADAAKSAA